MPPETIERINRHIKESTSATVEFRNPFVPITELIESCKENELLKQILKDLLMQCCKYTETVCRFEQIVKSGLDDVETFRQIDSTRKSIHDSTIDSINLLSRELRKAGKPNDWIKKVSSAGRAGYASFALTIAFEIVINRIDL